jgi:hypothetical protein
MRRRGRAGGCGRDHIGVIGEFLLADRAFAMLERDLPVHQLPHFAIRAQLPVAAWMVRVLDTADTDLPHGSLLRYRFPATAEPGMVDGTKLVATSLMEFLLEDISCSEHSMRPAAPPSAGIGGVLIVRSRLHPARATLLGGGQSAVFCSEA